MTELRLRRVPTQSRREHVVQILRNEITGGRLTPGDRLVELDLAKQLGTSRAPVREALRQLEQEGLVISHPYRGSEVLGVSQDEVEQVLSPSGSLLSASPSPRRSAGWPTKTSLSFRRWSTRWPRRPSKALLTGSPMPTSRSTSS